MSYTPEETASIVQEYNASPTRETVDAIAARTSKSTRSIIAKLAALGVYQTPERTTKTGEPIVKKEEMVASIEGCLGIKVPTLAKAGKQDLATLEQRIKELTNDNS